MFSNEVTIVFNLANSQDSKLLDTVFPHVLRVPREQLTQEPEGYLKQYTPFISCIESLLRNASDYYWGAVFGYIIQDDRKFKIEVSEIVDLPANILEQLQESILRSLEKCLDRFKIPYQYSEFPFQETLRVYCEQLQSKGIQQDSIVLYVLNDFSETAHPDELQKIKELMSHE